MKLLLGIGLFLLGQTFGWYQLNLQKMYDWWSDKPLMSAIVVGIPTSVFFWHGWKAEVGESVAWSHNGQHCFNSSYARKFFFNFIFFNFFI